MMKIGTSMVIAHHGELVQGCLRIIWEFIELDW